MAMEKNQNAVVMEQEPRHWLWRRTKVQWLGEEEPRHSRYGEEPRHSGVCLNGVHRTCAETAAVSCGTSHATTLAVHRFGGH